MTYELTSPLLEHVLCPWDNLTDNNITRVCHKGCQTAVQHIPLQSHLRERYTLCNLCPFVCGCWKQQKEFSICSFKVPLCNKIQLFIWHFDQIVIYVHVYLTNILENCGDLTFRTIFSLFIIKCECQAQILISWNLQNRVLILDTTI